MVLKVTGSNPVIRLRYSKSNKGIKWILKHQKLKWAFNNEKSGGVERILLGFSISHKSKNRSLLI